MERIFPVIEQLHVNYVGVQLPICCDSSVHHVMESDYIDEIATY